MPYADRNDLVKIRLSEWARRQGIARITAYRMLQKGIIPVPIERSPTGRWYVLVPKNRKGHIAFYTRAAPGLDSAIEINRQLEVLTRWCSARRQSPFVVVREIGHPFTQRIPKLGSLLADMDISDIFIAEVDVVGEALYNLLIAALAPQGRTIVIASQRAMSQTQKIVELEAAIAFMRSGG